MKKLVCLLILALLYSQLSHGQNFIPRYGQIVEQCSYDTLLGNLQWFEDLGIKELGTLSLDNTKNWIMDKYASYGYTDIQEDPFSYAGQNASNIIVTKTGLVYPNQYIIIDAHYDTKNGAGANDNGSGTVALLEIARLLKDIQTEYSLKFIHFSAEELGLIGSWHYVETVAIPDGLDIRLVFNIDGVGGVHGMENHTVVCERDEISPPFSNNEASATFTNELATCVSLYTALGTEISQASASDYIPFESHYKVITGLYEKNISPYYHSPGDVISHLDVNYIHEVTKAAIGASLHFAKASTDATGLAVDPVFPHGQVYPNPTTGNISIDLGEMHSEVKLTLSNAMGQWLLSKDLLRVRRIELNMEQHVAGLYMIRLELPSGEALSMLIVKE